MQCYSVRRSLKVLNRELKTVSLSKDTLAPESIKALILRVAQLIRNQVGVEGFTDTCNKGDECEKETDDDLSIMTNCCDMVLRSM